MDLALAPILFLAVEGSMTEWEYIQMAIEILSRLGLLPIIRVALALVVAASGAALFLRVFRGS